MTWPAFSPSAQSVIRRAMELAGSARFTSAEVFEALAEALPAVEVWRRSHGRPRSNSVPSQDVLRAAVELAMKNRLAEVSPACLLIAVTMVDRELGAQLPQHVLTDALNDT